MIKKEDIALQILNDGKILLNDAVLKAKSLKNIKNKDPDRAWKNIFAQKGTIIRDITGTYVTPRITTTNSKDIILPTSATRIIKSSNDEKILDEFFYKWINSNEWKGVNLFPYQMIIDEKYSFILKRTLEFIKNQPEYIKNGNILIKSSKDSEEICKKMHEYTKSLDNKRNRKLGHYLLFNKLEYNLLNHLKLITEKDWKYTLTLDGEIFSDINDFESMKKFYRNLFVKLGWYKKPQYNIHPVQFLFNILEKLKIISYDEYKFIVIYATSDSQTEEIINLINIYRNYPNKKNEYENYLNKNKTETEIKTFNRKLKFNLLDISILNNFVYDLKTDNLKLKNIENIENIKNNFPIKNTESKFNLQNKEEWIYIQRNAMFHEEIFKVGFSINPKKRAKQLSGTTSIPDNFFIIHKFKVINMQLAENVIFKILEPYRVNNNREFFKIPLDELIEKISKIVNFINLVENKISIKIED